MEFSGSLAAEHMVVAWRRSRVALVALDLSGKSRGEIWKYLTFNE